MGDRKDIRPVKTPLHQSIGSLPEQMEEEDPRGTG